MPACLELGRADSKVWWWSAPAVTALGLDTRKVLVQLVDAKDHAPVAQRQRANGALARMGWTALRAA